MTIFWLLAVLLIVAALLFLLPPLLQKGESSEQALERDALNLTIFKDRLEELKADLAAGVLTQEQYDVARHDIERDFLSDTEAEPGATEHTDRIVGRAAAVVVAMLVPILALSLYGFLGAGADGFDPKNAVPDVQAEGHEGTMEQQVAQLQEHLQATPEDGEGWMMLARSYYFMQKYADASESFRRASSLIQDADPNLLADWADAAAMANGRNMAGQPYELVKKALSMQPYHQKALWLAGTASYQAEDYKTTLEYWQRLLQLFPEGSENYVQMQRNIGEIKQMLGVPAASEQVPATPAVAASSLEGVVRLSPQLRDQVSPEDTVFIFARAASGPRMPLAILRKQVKDLPMAFTLDDSMAMNPAMKLSNYPQVVVGARISKSGNAMPQSGDLQGQMGPVVVSDAGDIELVIDSVVP